MDEQVKFSPQNVSEKTPAPQPNDNPSSRSKRIYLIVGILLVVLATSLGYVFRNETLFRDKSAVPRGTVPTARPVIKADETAKWKTYTDEQEKFSFRYPPDFSIHGNGPVSNSANAVIGKVISLGNEKGVSIDMIVTTNTTPANYPNQKPLVINGNTWHVSFDDPTKNNCADRGGLGACRASLTYYALLNGKSVGFTFRNTIQTEQPERIVSTFKFTDPTQTDSTANWKTYTNTKYGYSIKYPDDKFVNCVVQGQENTFTLTKGSDPKKDCFLGEDPAEFYIRDASSFTGHKQSTESDECITVNKSNVDMTNDLQTIEYTYSRTQKLGYCQKLNGYPDSVSYEVKNGDKTLIIYVFRKDDQIKKQILSTFKFL